MPSVRDTIVQQVDEWLAREVPRVRDEGVLSSIKFTIKAPGGDDDNTLVLDLDVNTRTQLYFDEEQGLRVLMRCSTTSSGSATSGLLRYPR